MEPEASGPYTSGVNTNGQWLCLLHARASFVARASLLSTFLSQSPCDRRRPCCSRRATVNVRGITHFANAVRQPGCMSTHWKCMWCNSQNQLNRKRLRVTLLHHISFTFTAGSKKTARDAPLPHSITMPSRVQTLTMGRQPGSIKTTCDAPSPKTPSQPGVTNFIWNKASCTENLHRVCRAMMP